MYVLCTCHNIDDEMYVEVFSDVMKNSTVARMRDGDGDGDGGDGGDIMTVQVTPLSTFNYAISVITRCG